MTATALPVAVLSGITLHAGVFHLLLYLRSSARLRADLHFGITAVLIALYDMASMGLYISTSVEQGMFWQRAQMTIISSAGLSFLYFVEAYAEHPGPKVARRLAWAFPLLALITLVERDGWMFRPEPAIKNFDLPVFGHVTYYEAKMGPLYDVLALGMVYVTVYALWVAIQVRRAGDRRRSRNITWAIVVFAVGAFNDALISEGVIESLYLVEYSWTAILVLGGYALSNELLSAAMSKQALAEGKVRLAHAERLESVGKLAGGVAHDLNNMLTPVIGYAQLAQTLAEPGSRQRTYMDHLVSAAERAAALTRHLLAFARKQVLEVRPIDLGQSLLQLEPLLRRLLPENIRLEIWCDSEVPHIEADRAQLEQVWMNLAANARDAMPNGGSLSFEITRSELERNAVPGVFVTVRDTGAGMSSSVVERAFNPFFSTKARGKGTGLGLSIVHGIVEQHGGRISLKSALGRGTTVQLFFPATDKVSELRPRSTRPVDRDLHGEERILVVDDDEAVLRLTVELLEQYGYQVCSAGSQVELLELLSHELPPIDLVLTDVMLPDMDGNEVQRVVSRQFPSAVPVFMTGHADEVLAPRGVLREHVELLRKPFTTDELLNKVYGALERARQRASRLDSAAALSDGRRS
ncbi:MAG: ATP-binding protein [Myxococcales bacterium]